MNKRNIQKNKIQKEGKEKEKMWKREENQITLKSNKASKEEKRNEEKRPKKLGCYKIETINNNKRMWMKLV